ncbi:YqaA family protein [Lacinutrix iliipiscaria]|uniref:YqaA family protein n=1 Tax=Lacinutrix iliipiscaria TaxID=1230532 RepID=A0ABW5WPH5_9FLAO
MKPTKTRPKSEKSRLQLLHQYYTYTGFYTFVGNAIKKALPYVTALIILLAVINQFVDINAMLVSITQALPTYGVLAFFFTSEALLGLVPPEIFIVWAGKMTNPWLFLSVLAILSYLGGLVSYYLGHLMTKKPAVHNYIEAKMEKQLKNSKKWGGFLIIVGALLPVPFSVSCMAAGLIEFPFKKVMGFGALRLVRFAIYGLIIFNVI